MKFMISIGSLVFMNEELFYGKSLNDATTGDAAMWVDGQPAKDIL
jgi:hypothetical protein